MNDAVIQVVNIMGDKVIESVNKSGRRAILNGGCIPGTITIVIITESGNETGIVMNENDFKRAYRKVMRKKDSEFPDYYTIDDLGLDALCYCLRKEYDGKTVLISIEEEEMSRN